MQNKDQSERCARALLTFQKFCDFSIHRMLLSEGQKQSGEADEVN